MNKAGIYKSLLLALGLSLISSYTVSREISDHSAFEKDTQSEEHSYHYNTEGRWDPFKPFVAPKSSSPTQDPNEIMDEGKELVGMQLFEPGQLTLVGVMLSLQEPLALVEDQTRKGYVLKLGNLIGRRGVVSSIDHQQVLITETAKTRAGKEIKNTTTMRIKREGDK